MANEQQKIEAFRRPDLGCDASMDRVIDHEKQLNTLAINTGILKEQYEKLDGILTSLSNTMIEIKDAIKEQKKQNEQLVCLSVNITEIKDKISSLERVTQEIKKENEDQIRKIEDIENVTSHLSWLSKGIVKVEEKIGVIIIAILAAIALVNISEIQCLLKSIFSFIK
ncbi:MAG: hypothetical protein RBR68_16045 [Tenuifilaceae bacterium]|jgi:chromosome segregation ATPase|nr:hypothetical protein [Tenuifilaceae bacterium]